MKGNQGTKSGALKKPMFSLFEIRLTIQELGIGRVIANSGCIWKYKQEESTVIKKWLSKYLLSNCQGEIDIEQQIWTSNYL